jgi:putative membrane protein
MTLQDLPAVNASLNALSTVFLTLGFIFIKRGNKDMHRNCMLAAFVTSTIFLTCYLIYHLNVKAVTKFAGEGWIRPVYFLILISHIILAIVIVPLIFMTLSRAIKQRFELHRKIARITWPLWMYVSITGVFVYMMLYQWFPAK